MANPWDADPIISAAPAQAPPPAAAGNPWDDDPIIGEDPGLEIEIRGGTPVPAATFDASAPAPAEPSFLDNQIRGLGLGARSVLQGAGGLVDAFGGEAFNRFIVPGEQPTYRQIGARAADALGLPAAADARERVLGDVGEALTGTGLTMGAGSLLSGGGQLAQRMGNFLTSQPGLQTLSTITGAAAAGTARESGATGGQQMLAGLIGGLAPGAAGATTAATLRGAVRGTSGEDMLRTIDDFRSVGAEPSVGQASGSRTLQGVENLLAGGPTSAGVMARFAERQADDIGAGLQQRAEGISRNASAERAGRAVERGVEGFDANVGAQKRALYWQADRFIPEQTPVALANTWQAVDRLTTPVQGATATTAALINPRIAQLRQSLAQDLAAGGGSIPYQALKRIRTDIGEAIGGASPLNPPTDLRELRQLYGALSRDMEAAARAQGPAAERAARRANNYTRAAADRLEQVQRVVDKNGGPEKVFNAAMAGTRDGGTTLRAVMQSLPPDGQRAVTAAVIKRMGLANPGAQDAAGDVFSAQTFLTNWNKVSPEAKRALFDRYGAGFSADMDRVARVAENIRDGSKVFANPSGTANRAAAMSYGLAVVGSLLQAPFTGNVVAPTLAIGGGAFANVLARQMTKPYFVRWLARATEAPVGSAVAQAQTLRQIGERNEDRELINVANALQQEGQREPANANN